MLSGLLLGLRAAGSVTLMRVVGRSMAPTLCDGDVVVVRQLRSSPLKLGHIVVFRHPDTRVQEPVIKRIAASQIADVGNAMFLYLVGDNPAESQDSRHFGAVPVSAVSSVVLFRLPLPRTRGKSPE